MTMNENEQSDDLVLVPRGLLAACSYIIRHSNQADSKTARAVRAASMQATHTTHDEIAKRERHFAAIEASRERDEA